MTQQQRNVPTLSGEKVTLRCPVQSDVAARFALGRDPDIYEMFGVSRRTVSALTMEDAAAWVQRIENHPHAWIIDCGGLIGEIRLDQVDSRDSRASMAIAIYNPQRLGKGLGPAAMKLLLKYAFEELHLHRISVRVLAYNERAIRAYQKCGFHIEGREREAALVNGQWHDDVMMGLLDREFQS